MRVEFLICFTEARVLRIETKQAPRPSQPEVVLSDGMILHFILISLLVDKIQNLHELNACHFRTNLVIVFLLI